MRRTVTVGSVVLLLAASLAGAATPEDAIKYRKAVMSSMAAHAGAIAMIFGGKVDFPDYLLDAIFGAVGTVPVFQGFMALYVEGEDNQENGNGEKKLPSLSEGEVLELLHLTPKQHFTQPPYRYSEATLIKELEEKGIGRPSTYATILATIKEKGYVRLEKGKFSHTELGCMVNDLLVVNFPAYF